MILRLKRSVQRGRDDFPRIAALYVYLALNQANASNAVASIVSRFVLSLQGKNEAN
jgi:hypothetical protein